LLGRVCCSDPPPGSSAGCRLDRVLILRRNGRRCLLPAEGSHFTGVCRHRRGWHEVDSGECFRFRSGDRWLFRLPLPKATGPPPLFLSFFRQRIPPRTSLLPVASAGANPHCVPPLSCRSSKSIAEVAFPYWWNVYLFPPSVAGRGVTSIGRSFVRRGVLVFLTPLLFGTSPLYEVPQGSTRLRLLDRHRASNFLLQAIF